MQMIRTKGFTLLESILVLAVVSSLLLGLMQVQRGARQQQSLLTAAEDMSSLVTAIYHQVMLQQTIDLNSLTVSDLQASGLYRGRVMSPWETPYELLAEPTLVIVQVDVGSPLRAERLGGLLANARVQGTHVESVVPMPIQGADAAHALHRYAQPDAPELNQMFTNLDMNYFNIDGVATLYSESIDSQSVDTATMTANVLLTNELQSQTLLSEVAFIDELATQIASFNELWVNEGHMDVLQVNEIYAPTATAIVAELWADMLHTDSFVMDHLTVTEQLTSTQVNAQEAFIDVLHGAHATFQNIQAGQLVATSASSDVLNTNTLTAQQFTTDSVTVQTNLTANRVYADWVYASDVITPHGSMSQLNQQLEQYQLLWAQCVEAGGCR